MSISEPMRELIGRITTRLPVGTAVQFATVGRAPRLQRRVDARSAAQELIEVARQERMERGTPFWHALFYAGARLQGGVPDEIFESAFYHQRPSTDDTLRLVVEHQGIDDVAALERQLGTDEVLMLTSRVVLPDGQQAHLPLLDFSLKAHLPGAHLSVAAAARALGEHGELTATGRSFHFFGQMPLADDKWRAFMAKALLLSPITDERWIAHQLLAGYASLRISASDKGDAPTPLGPVRVSKEH